MSKYELPHFDPRFLRLLEDHYLEGIGDGPCRVGRVAHERFEPGFHLARRDRPNVAGFVVLAGGARYRGEAGWQEVADGWFFTLVPGVHHEIRCPADGHLEVIRIVCPDPATGQRLRELFGRAGVARAGVGPVGTALARDLLRTAALGTPHAGARCRHLYELLLLTLADGGHGEHPRSGGAEATFRRLRGLVAAACTGGTRLEEIAAAGGVSYGYMCRLFRCFEQATPHAYRQDLRMAEAARLLAERRLPLAAVAEAVGYSDAYAFAKAFKRHTGLPPGGWRRTGPEA